MKDYRKYYAKYYGIKWDTKAFDVHHIDRDRENNDIRNLVLLPKSLHSELHRVYGEVDRMLAFSSNPLMDAAKESLNPCGGYLTGDTLDEYLHILKRCQPWGQLKAFNYRRGKSSETIQIDPDDIYELYI